MPKLSVNWMNKVDLY